MRKGFASRLLGVRNERGSTLVEFALAFPVLAGLMFGIIDGGRFISARVMLSQAVAEAARTACLSTTATAATVDTTLTGASAMLVGANVDWAASECNGAAGGCVFPRATNDVVFLQAQYNFQAAYFRIFSRNMTQTSRMVCE